ncbi:hypothetical protein JCM8547_003380 [Rhodosporidiobolus lusitaniae]
MTTPRPHLLPGWDSAKAKVAELRGILLEHDVPFPSNAKKPDLVSLFEKHVRPQAAALLAQLSSVRPSTHGILDGDSQDGSLRELDTDSEQERQFEEEQRRKKSGRKRVGRRKSTLVQPLPVPAEGPKSAKKRGSSKKRQEEEEEEVDELESSQHEVEDSDEEIVVAPPLKKKGKNGRKSLSELVKQVDAGEFDEGEDELAAEEVAEVEQVSPKKRKTSDGPGPATPRLSGLKVPRSALKHQLDSPSADAGNFSDYNPFQSGGEETPGREVKRRKSSLGPDRLKSRKSTVLPSASTSSSTPHVSGQKSIPALPSSSSLAPPSSAHKRSRQSEIPPVPPLPSPSTAALASSSFFAPPPSAGAGAGASASIKKPRRSEAAREVRREPEPEPEYEEEVEEQEDDELMEDDEVEVEEEYGGGMDRTEQYGEEDGAMEDVSYEAEAEPEPEPVRAPPTPAASTSIGRGTPVGQKYMVPVSKVKTTPPHMAQQLREYAASSSSTATPARAPAAEGGAVQYPSGQTKQVSIQASTSREKEKMGRYSTGSPAVARLQREGGGGGGEGAGSGGTPRRSLPVAAERQLATRAAPAPPVRRSSPSVAVSVSPRKKPSTVSSASSAVSTAVRAATSSLSTLTSYALPLLLLSYALWYRSESLALGFCSTSSTSSPQSLTRSERGLTSLSLPSLPSLSSSLLATLDSTHLRPSCTPCPSHGVCTDGLFTGCVSDFVPRPSLLQSLTFGLVPAAPTCEADTEKQVAVARAAASAGRVLRRRRGEVRCEGRVERARRKEMKTVMVNGETEEEREAYVYGLEAEGVMRALGRENEASGAPFPDEVLDEISCLALRDLEQHGEVVVWQNGDTFFYAARTADMPLSCRARLALIASAKKHKMELFVLLSTLATVLWGRMKVKRRKEDKERVRELVRMALRQLQQQERSHLLSPSTVPYPHLAPSHLRDLLLTSIHSPSRRAELWRAVEKVVEGNANVRVGEVEVGGEEMRGWRWTGPTSVEDGQGEGGEGGGEGRREMVQVGGKGVGTPGRG